MSFLNEKKYYVITCKFGHVGRDKYLPLDVPIRAYSKKDASDRARNIGGVKRDHPDWCLKEPREITKAEYFFLRQQLERDPYWDKRTRQNISLFVDRLVDEPNYSNIRGFKTNTVSFKKPTTSEIKMYHKKKKRIIDRHYRVNHDYDD